MPGARVLVMLIKFRLEMKTVRFTVPAGNGQSVKTVQREDQACRSRM